MDFNKIYKHGDTLVMRTQNKLADKITKEFPQFQEEYHNNSWLYTFTTYPNMSFALRALLAAYPDTFTAETDALIVIRDGSELSTMPILSLYHTEKHVKITCPPLNYYLDLVSAVGASNQGMNTYTVPIARAFDVIRAVEVTQSYLPGFVIAKNLKDVLVEPLEGFNGTISSLFEIPLTELHAAARAYRVKPENWHNHNYYSVADFLVTQPQRYIDKTQISSFFDLEKGMPVNFIGKIVDKQLINYRHTRFDIAVGNTVFQCMYYYRTWMYDKFNINDEVLLMGEYAGGVKITGQSLESIVEAQALDIVPIYAQSPKNNITSKIILNTVYEAIARIKPHVDELDFYINKSEMPMSLGKAIQEMHFPTSSYSYVEALETLALYEMTYLQLLIIHRKANEVKAKGIPKPYIQGGYFDAMVSSLPWELTNAQKSGLRKMNEYMSTDTAEQVLLTADVGSGKTLVAQLSCMQALDNGYQSVLAGPTEVLAIQLYDTFIEAIDRMPEDKRPSVAFLGGKMKAKERRELLKYIKSGDIDIVVGTHSVLNANIEYNNLGLVVIDEQQKFGTAQREALLESRDDGRKPDLLAQTATPIPRSTAQAFYGDIDMIQLDGKPPGRIKVVTEWIKDKPNDVTKNKDHPMWEDIRKEVEKGHQVFVVVPMVYESKKMDSASVEGAYKDLKKTLKGIPIGYTHGSLKKADQHEAMRAFRENETKVLIASTVIEVGVDVPNATRMVVLSADRLGASSLHQIRGRVGRSNLPSTCYLVSEGKTASSKKRLQALVDSDDGFDIAKVDLQTRGEGDLFGLRQAGESSLRFASLVDHSKFVSQAQRLANDIYNSRYRDVALKDAKAILSKDS